MSKDDPKALAEVFGALGWPGKGLGLFERYREADAAGTTCMMVAQSGPEVVGYVGLHWVSRYQPFRSERVPEIIDLNVLPEYRRHGFGGALLDAVEAIACERSHMVGLGVGLHADYANAWRLYLGHGFVPDGQGLVYDGSIVPFGASVILDDSATLMMLKRLRSVSSK